MRTKNTGIQYLVRFFCILLLGAMLLSLTAAGKSDTLTFSLKDKNELSITVDPGNEGCQLEQTDKGFQVTDASGTALLDGEFRTGNVFDEIKEIVEGDSKYSVLDKEGDDEDTLTFAIHDGDKWKTVRMIVFPKEDITVVMQNSSAETDSEEAVKYFSCVRVKIVSGFLALKLNGIPVWGILMVIAAAAAAAILVFLILGKLQQLRCQPGDVRDYTPAGSNSSNSRNGSNGSFRDPQYGNAPEPGAPASPYGGNVPEPGAPASPYGGNVPQAGIWTSSNGEYVPEAGASAPVSPRAENTIEDDGRTVAVFGGGTTGFQMPVHTTLVLRQVDNPGAAYSFDLDRPVTVGRSARKSMYVIPGDKTISGCHCEFRLENGAVVVRDMNSSNGTWVNEVRIGRDTGLNQGDVLTLGNTHLSVEIH